MPNLQLTPHRLMPRFNEGLLDCQIKRGWREGRWACLKNIVDITYEELTRGKPTTSDLISVVQSFLRRDLLLVLARLNLLVSIGTTAQALATDRQLCNLVFRVHRQAIKALRQRYQDRVVFNRLSLLFLLTQVLLTGIDGSRAGYGEGPPIGCSFSFSESEG